MSEPRRLKHETRSTLARALLESAVADRSDPGARERVLGAIGVSAVVMSASAASAALKAGTTSGAAASATAPAIKGVGLVVAKWAALVMLGGAAVVGVHQVVRAADVTESVSTPAIAHPAAPHSVVAPAAPQASSLPVEPEAPPSDEHLAPPPKPAPRKPATANSNSPVAVEQPQPSTISEQTRILDSIRKQIASHDGPRALASLDAFQARYPMSRFAEEVTVLRIDALVASERRAEAAAQGSAFLARNPRSAYAGHVENTLVQP